MPPRRQKPRKVLDDRYYRAQAMLRDESFRQMVAWLRRRFSEVGCPIPDGGFSDWREYDAWNSAFWKRWSEMQHDEEYLRRRNEILQGKTRWGTVEQDALEKLEKDYLPPIYGQIFRDIINSFDVTETDQKLFRDFIERVVFFGETELRPGTFIVHMKLNEKTRKPEMFLRIFGYTRLEDIKRDWSLVAQYQRDLPDYLGKSRGWKNFDRDLRIFGKYQELKRLLGSKSRLPHKPSYLNRLDMRIYQTISREFGQDLTWENIRTIVTRTRRRLGH